MDVVCLGHHAPPMNDAEALCTARLMSALARRGVRVCWIARSGPETLEPDVVRELVDARIEFRRLEVAPATRWHRFVLACRYRLWAPFLEWAGPAAAAARRELRARRGAILISRAMPVASHVAAFLARREAALWICHLSDPYPPLPGRGSLGRRLAQRWHRAWARRWLRTAQGITVTCRRAGQYVQEYAGPVDEGRLWVVTHLALPPLTAAPIRLDRHGGEFVLAHIGNFMAARRPDVVFGAVLRAAEECPGLRLVQYGAVDPAVGKALPGTAGGRTIHIHPHSNLSPREAAALQQQADANLVVDTDLGLPYSPFLLSKYPHAVCSGRPVLAVAPEQSAMADYIRRFGGGRVAPYDPEAVARAIRGLYAARHQQPNPYAPSGALQEEFSESRIVEPFFVQWELWRRSSRREGGA